MAGASKSAAARARVRRCTSDFRANKALPDARSGTRSLTLPAGPSYNGIGHAPSHCRRIAAGNDRGPIHPGIGHRHGPRGRLRAGRARDPAPQALRHPHAVDLHGRRGHPPRRKRERPARPPGPERLEGEHGHPPAGGGDAGFHPGEPQQVHGGPGTVQGHDRHREGEGRRGPDHPLHPGPGAPVREPGLHPHQGRLSLPARPGRGHHLHHARPSRSSSRCRTSRSWPWGPS